MSSRRQTAAARRTTPPAGQTQSFLPEEVVAFLAEGGWVTNDETPSTVSLWAHVSKGGGSPLASDQAYELEKAARAAAASIAGGADGSAAPVVESDEEKAARIADEQALLSEEDRVRAEGEAEHQRKVAEALLRRIEETQRQRDEAAEAQPELVHDQIGPVSIFRCYSCGLDCRYSIVCPCERCVTIRQGKECPKCGTDDPHTDPRRR